MIGLCGYIVFVFILELAAATQRRQQSMQINQRFWNTLSWEQRGPAALVLPFFMSS